MNNIGPSFKGNIRVGDNPPLKTDLFKDDIILSQLTNNLRRVGIDRHPGTVDSDGGLVIQPGLVVRHNEAGDTVTFNLQTGKDQKVVYEITKDQPQQTENTTMPDHKTIVADAVKFIDKVVAKAKAKADILAKVDLTKSEEIFSVIHRNTF